MARRPNISQRKQIEALADKLEPVMRAAFMEIIADIVNGADLSAIISALKDGDIDGAIAAVNISRAAFRPVDLAVMSAFEAGGVSAMAALPVMRDQTGAQIRIRFDVRNPAAENRILTHSGRLITGFTDEMIDISRRVFSEGLQQGIAPRQSALKLIGEIDKKTGRRAGGMIGLNNPQSIWVENAIADLEQKTIVRVIDGVEVEYKGSLKKYLTRDARDRRFDGQINKAIESGKPLDDAAINKITGRYSDRLLKSRAETIGRSETMEALNASRIASYSQIADETGVSVIDAEKVWKATKDTRTRHQHADMDGVSVMGLDTPFTMPDGSLMQYPCDGSLGAGAHQRINCRCTVFIRLNYMKGLK